MQCSLLTSYVNCFMRRLKIQLWEILNPWLEKCHIRLTQSTALLTFFPTTVMCTRCHFMALCLGLPGWASTRTDIHPLTPKNVGMWDRCLSSFWILRGVGKIEASAPTIRLDATPSGPSMPPPPSSPPVLCRMSFLPQPSQFILAWDRHQICWMHTWRLGYSLHVY